MKINKISLKSVTKTQQRSSVKREAKMHGISKIYTLYIPLIAIFIVVLGLLQIICTIYNIRHSSKLHRFRK